MKNKKNKYVASPLPVIFVCSIFFITVLNISNFKTSYEQSIESKPNDRQAALSLVETKFNDSFEGKTNYLDLNGLFSRLVFKKELNNVIRLNNGYLTTVRNEGSSSYYIESTVEFRDYLELYDIPFACVQAPYAHPTDDSMMPAGYSTYTNKIVDDYLDGLEENGITTLDIRELMLNSDKDYYDYFPKTDHHWTPEAAFWAHEHIATLIDSVLGESYANPDYFNLENYNVEVLKNSWLGSRGQRTGIFWGGIDDLSIITPKFETDLRLLINKIDKRGDFEEVYKKDNTSVLSQTIPYNMNLYDATFYDGLYGEIFNYNSTNDLKIFVIRDSFTSPLFPYLSLHYKNVNVYNMREDMGSTPEYLLEKIQSIKPDIVIHLIYSGAIEDQFFNYLTEDAKNEVKNNY